MARYRWGLQMGERVTSTGDSLSGGNGSVDFGRAGDWTSWSSLLVLLMLAPLTALCLAPLAFVASEVLPGGFRLWMIPYFAALLVVLIPGLEFLQVRLVCPQSRRPTPEELARLVPPWDRVLAEVGKGKRRRYRLRVSDDQRINAAAGGGSLVIVTTRALTSLSEDQLEAVLAHEFGHHVGFHPMMLLAQQWLARPLAWAARLSVAVHNLLAWMTRWRMHPLAFVLVWAAILLIRLALLALDAIVKAATLVLLFLGRRAEYNADTVATRLGYGHPLIGALAEMERQGEAALAHQQAPVPISPFWDTHPPTPNRIARIREALGNS